MQRTLFIICCLLTPVFQGIAAVRLELSDNEIRMDEVTSLVLTVDGGLQRRPPTIPLPEGLKVVGTNFMTLTGAEGSEARITYELSATQTGRFQIGPYQLEMNDGKHDLPKLTLTVLPAENPTAEEDVFVTMELSPGEAIIRQSVELTLTFYSVNSIENIQIEELSTEGFADGDWQELRIGSKLINGERYKARRIRKKLTPLKAGDYTFHPTVLVQVAVPSDLRRDPAFGMFSRRFKLENIQIKPKTSASLTVSAPPEEGRPDTYQGHVGRFVLNAYASPTDVNAGDPVTLRVQLSGSGSIREALPPRMTENEDFNVYDAKLISEDLARSGLSGAKTFEQVLIPKHDGVTEVPQLEFSYYDPDQKTYVTRTVGPFPITVTGSIASNAEPGFITSIETPNGGTSPSPTLLGNDLIYLKTSPVELSALNSLSPGIEFGAMAGIPFVLWGLCALGAYLRRPERWDEQDTRRKQAPLKLKAQLKTLTADSGDSQAFYAAVWNCLSDYLRDQFSLPPGEITFESVSDQLPDTTQTETIVDLKTWIQTCERARFGAISGEEEIDRQKQDFQEFMLRLDQEVRS